MSQQQMMPGQYGAMGKQMTPGLVGQFPQGQGTPSPAGLPGQSGLTGGASAYQPSSLLQQQQQQMQFQHLQHQQHQHQQQLQHFWQQQMQEVEQAHDFKNHQLPLARIKKIMKADEDVRMISAEAPVVFSKACEMFILELTLRSWIHTEENKRRTLQKNDIAGAITRTDIFDFLVDIVPRDELKEEGIGVPRAQVPMGGNEVTYGGMYFMPQGAAATSPIPQPSVVPPSMMVGRPASGLQMDASSMYSHGGAMQYVQQGLPQGMWPQQGLPQVPGSMPQQQG